MKRSAIFLAWTLPLLFLVGCDGGGVEVGPPKTAPTTSVTPDFRAAMEKAGGKMQSKRKPKDAITGAPEKTP